MRKIVAASALTLAAAMGTAHAAPFSTVDARMMGMGGAGVAVGSTEAGAYYNPALLTGVKASNDFSFALGAGLWAADPDELIDAVDEFQDEDYIDRLEASIEFAEANATADNFRVVADNLDETSVGLSSVSDKVFQGELGAGIRAATPNVYKGVSVGLHVANSTHLSAVGRYRDAALLEDVSNEIELAAVCYEGGDPDASACDTSQYQYVDVDNGTVLFDPEQDLESEIQLRGVAISEVGLAVAREFSFEGLPAPLSIGVTPKLMRVDVFDYDAPVSDFEIEDADSEEYRRDYTDFNLDVGVSSQFDNGIRAGLVVKNLIGQDYETAMGGTVSLKPQARAGVAYGGSFYTVAADVDLTENESVGFEEPTRFVSVGGELDAFGWAQLRAGVRYDTVNSDRSTASVGLGLSPFGVAHLDLAVVGSSNAVGAALRLGMNF